MPPNWRAILLQEPAGTLPNRPDRLYRSAALSLATDAERASCPAGLTWFDLRIDDELRRDRHRSLPSSWRTVRYPIVAEQEAFTREQTLRSIADIAAGRKSWGDLYCAAIDAAVARFAGALDALAAVEGPVVIACQGGRDRTGILVALLLSVVGADRQVIVDDYLRTNLDKDEANRRQPPLDAAIDAAELDLTCHTSDIVQLLDHLDGLGGARAYLAAELAERDIDAIVERLRPRLLL